MEELKKRKHPRLKTHNYSESGMYFITVCAKDMKCIFGKIVGRGALTPPQTELFYAGKILNKYINGINKVYENVRVLNYVIMPNHFHIIIKINDNGGVRAPRPTVNEIIKGIKGLTTREIGYSVFQKSFYDHIIRDDEDYITKAEYIENNPAKWLEDKYYII